LLTNPQYRLTFFFFGAVQKDAYLMELDLRTEEERQRACCSSPLVLVQSLFMRAMKCTCNYADLADFVDEGNKPANTKRKNGIEGKYLQKNSGEVLRLLGEKENT